MVDPERTYGRFGYEKAPKPEPEPPPEPVNVKPWVRRTVKCSKCGAEVDRQTAESGEHFVGALLTGDAMRIHGDETGCWGGEAVPSDWKIVPPKELPEPEPARETAVQWNVTETLDEVRAKVVDQGGLLLSRQVIAAVEVYAEQLQVIWGELNRQDERLSRIEKALGDRTDATAEAAREAREHNYEIQREAYERGQEMMEEDKETQGRLVGGLLGEVLSGRVKPK